jgi:alpha-ketoglutarate-dependent taurine dioxygenase
MRPIDFQTLKSAADAYQVRFGFALRAGKVLQHTNGMSVHLRDVPFAKRGELFDELAEAVRSPD